jgi:hypothetical protein
MKSIVKGKAKSEKQGRVFLFIFFLIFACIGGGMIYPLGIKPIRNTISAGDWPEVACNIVSAEVESHSGSDDGTTYSVEITYKYEFDGREYQSDRYDFTDVSSGGHEGKAKVVSFYKNAANPVCFVNPEKPSEAVLKRGFHWGLLVALSPLPFLGVGFGGLCWLVFSKNKGKSAKKRLRWKPKAIEVDDEVDSYDDFSAADVGMVEVKSKSPLAALFVAILFAAFWNGIVSVFLVQVIKGWRSGHGDWFLTLFMVPFVLIGAGLIGYVVMRFLMLFNPRPKVMLSSASIRPGSAMQMQWRFSGRVSMLQRISIVLKGVEKATYRRGTDTTTDTNTFFQMEILSTEDRYEIISGQVAFALPDSVMHSFDAPNNKIVWELSLAGVIDRWPDVDETYSITVMP